MYSYEDSEQRARWSNSPTPVVPRGGINLKSMTPAQRTAALELMKIVLSPMGYEKVNQIRLADDDFKVNGSKRGPPGGGPPGGNGGPPPGGGPGRGPGSRPSEQSGSGPPFAGQDLFGQNLYYTYPQRRGTGCRGRRTLCSLDRSFPHNAEPVMSFLDAFWKAPRTLILDVQAFAQR